jgi:hypothetical protein
MLMQSPSVDVLQRLMTDLDPEARYVLVNAITNQVPGPIDLFPRHDIDVDVDTSDADVARAHAHSCATRTRTRTTSRARC